MNPPAKQPSDKCSNKRSSIILLHGYRGSPLGLNEIAAELRAAGYDVHVPAVPPFAGANGLTEYTPAQYAEYFANYITEHQLQRPILIGHSMGSIIVSLIANLKPELINEKVVLLSPISRKTSKAINFISPLTSILPISMTDYITTRFLFVPRHSRALFQHSLTLTHDCSNDCPPSNRALRQVTLFTTNYAVPDFPLRDKKVLIIAGAKDRLVKKRDTEKLANSLNAELKFLPNSGHLHNYEKPHETAAEILEFLQD